MDAVTLSRIQFGLTVGFHFLFPPLTIGLSWFIFGFMNRYKNTGDEVYKNMAQFWTKMLTTTFVIGVASGIAMEFQFGTNWARYSRFVGDIFGAPLAIEAIFTFFLESTFLAVLILGWDKFSVGVQWLSSMLVAVGATLSAFWILVANSWQQTPAGFVIEHDHARLTNFATAVFNPSTIQRFIHTIDASLMTGSFFILGISAAYILRGKQNEFVMRSFKSALIIAFIASCTQLVTGHFHGMQVAATQPAKLAAYEGIFTTQRRAPLLIIGIPNPDTETTRSIISVPGMLSFLSFWDINAEVKGLKAFPKSDRPPVLISFYTFHVMVALGIGFIGLTGLGILTLWMKRLFSIKILLVLMVIAVPFPFIANELGWIATEVGRQPWVVYYFLRTSNAASPSVPAAHIFFTTLVFTLIYALLFFLWIYILNREYKYGLDKMDAGEVAL